jgi:hypothetical protein
LKKTWKEEEVEVDIDRWINDVEENLRMLGVKRWEGRHWRERNGRSL